MKTIQKICLTLMLLLLLGLCSCQSEQLNFNPVTPYVDIGWTNAPDPRMAITNVAMDYLYPVTTNYQSSTNWVRLYNFPFVNGASSFRVTNSLPSPFMLTLFNVGDDGIWSVPAVPVIWSLTNGVPASPANLTAK